MTDLPLRSRRPPRGAPRRHRAASRYRASWRPVSVVALAILGAGACGDTTPTGAGRPPRVRPALDVGGGPARGIGGAFTLSAAGDAVTAVPPAPTGIRVPPVCRCGCG